MTKNYADHYGEAINHAFTKLLHFNNIYKEFKN